MREESGISMLMDSTQSLHTQVWCREMMQDEMDVNISLACMTSIRHEEEDVDVFVGFGNVIKVAWEIGVMALNYLDD